MKNLELRSIMLKFRSLPSSQLLMVMGVAVILVLAIDFFAFLRPQLGGIAALDRQREKIKTDIETLTTNKQRMVPYRKSLEAMRVNMNNFKAMVHKPDEISAVLKTVSTLANEYDVKMDQMVPQKNDGTVLVKNEDGVYGSVAILIRAKAGFHQLGRFLSRLEKERIFWHLETVEIAADAASSTHHLVKMQMRILVLGE